MSERPELVMPIRPQDENDVLRFCREATTLLDAIKLAKDSDPENEEYKDLGRRFGVELHGKIRLARQVTEEAEAKMTRPDYRANLDAVREVAVRLIGEIFEPVPPVPSA